MTELARSGTLFQLIRGIRSALFGRVRRRRRAEALVADFNALSLPRGYVCIVGDDHDEQIHYVRIVPKAIEHDDDDRLGAVGVGVAHEADVVWRYEAPIGRWTLLKNRRGLNVRDGVRPVFLGGMERGHA